MTNTMRVRGLCYRSRVLPGRLGRDVICRSGGSGVIIFADQFARQKLMTTKFPLQRVEKLLALQQSTLTLEQSALTKVELRLGDGEARPPTKQNHGDGHALQQCRGLSSDDGPTICTTKFNKNNSSWTSIGRESRAEQSRAEQSRAG